MRRAFFMRYSFPKKEHLTKKEHFDGLHAEGRGVKAFPFTYVTWKPSSRMAYGERWRLWREGGLKKAVERNK